MKNIFRFQFWNLLSLLILIFLLQIFLNYNGMDMGGSLWGVKTKTWFWLAVAVPVLHQAYVWLVWRIELYKHTFTSHFGVKKAFKLFTIGFSVLFASRLFFIGFLAFSNRGSLPVKPIFAYSIAALITPLVIYLFYSVIRYFGLKRAYGIDHFDKSFNAPFVKKGIFRFTNNGMYVFGFLILYLPGLVLLSKLALIVAVFNHIYIWAHFYFTEQPDIKKIYGNEKNRS